MKRKKAMKRAWKVLAPLAVTGLGALAAGVTVLLQKVETAPAAPAAPAAKSAGEEAPARDPATLSFGTYSFISGFQNAATIEVGVPFDPATESFSVVSEDYLSPSDDSHVALLYSEDYRLQFEYASFYGGESWDEHVAALREKHPDLCGVLYGENTGVVLLAGDSLRLDLRIPDETASFLQVTIQKTPAFDGKVTDLITHHALVEQLADVTFTRS